MIEKITKENVLSIGAALALTGHATEIIEATEVYPDGKGGLAWLHCLTIRGSGHENFKRVHAWAEQFNSATTAYTKATDNFVCTINIESGEVAPLFGKEEE